MINNVCIGESQPCATEAQECASPVFYQLPRSATEEELIGETCRVVGLETCRLLGHDDACLRATQVAQSVVH